MAIGTSVALSPDPATDVDTNTVTFALRAADLNRSEYSVAGLANPEEKLLTVSHETTKDDTQRHLVRIDRTMVDAITGVPVTFSAYVVIVRPPSTTVTNAVLYEGVNSLIDFLIEGGSNTRLGQILNNEV